MYQFDEGDFQASPQTYGASPCCGGRAQAYPATDYCAAAKAGIRSAGGNWDSWSCDQVKSAICADATLFVGADPIRIWACGSGNGGGNGGGGTTTPSNNTALLIAGVAAVGAVAIAMASASKKKVMAVRIK